MVGLGDQGAVGQIMDVGEVVNEVDIGGDEGVQTPQGIIPCVFDGDRRLCGRLSESGPRHRREEGALVAEVHVGRLMADTHPLSNLAKTEPVRRLGLQEFQRSGDEA